MFDFAAINIWGTVAAALAMFALGGLWFSPALFGRQWAESIKASPKELGSPAVAFALFLLTSTGIAFLAALLFSAAGVDTTVKGLEGGVLLGGLFFLVSLGDAGFTGHLRARWWWIQAAYRIVATVLLCAIVGASAPAKPVQQLHDAVDQGLKDLGVK
jgi:hypothetical protein